MKKLLFQLIIVVIFSAFTLNANAGNGWTKETNFAGAARYYGTGFSIGSYGFTGCGFNGSTHYNDFYKWNQKTNSWSTIANYPGSGYGSSIGFSVEGKGYVGLGETSGSEATDLWQYDTGTNSWTEKTSLPGKGRYDAAWFVIGHKVYVIGGSSGGTPYLNDAWVYDTHADSWKQLNNSPANAIDGMVGFAIGNHGYIGGGGNGSSSSGQTNFWEYDTTNDSWTPIASYPASKGIEGDARAFVIGSKAYLCTGADGGSYTNPTTVPVGYVYDTLTKGWTEFTSMGAQGIERAYSVTFTINNYGYICTGMDSIASYQNSLWQYGLQDTSAQKCNYWTKETNFAGAARYYGTGFSIGSYGFTGCGFNGSTHYNDFYKWNQKTNSWSTIANYPGSGYGSSIGFSVEGKGYVGLGETSGSEATDLWQYDTGTNSWTEKTSLPGKGRYDAAWFVIGHKVYVIGGSSGGTPYLNDAWVYDTHADSWKQLNNSPANAIDGMVGFAIGNHGYLGGGGNGSSSSGQTNFWEYDTTNDSWTPIASYPASKGIEGDARAFVIGSKAYLCTGADGGSYTNPTTVPVGYVYDTLTKGWTEFTSMGAQGIERAYSVTFTINNYGYICTGMDSIASYQNSLWQYYPCSDTLLSVNEIVAVSGEIKLYPNPSSGIVNITYTGLYSERSELRIIDLMGRTVSTIEISGKEGHQVIDESNLSNGMYFYQFMSSNLTVSTGKIIITR